LWAKFKERAYSAVNHPPVRLEENGWAKVLVLVPPVAGAGGAAAGAEDALVETVELVAVLRALKVLLVHVGGPLLLLEPGLDGFVLVVELGEIRDEVLDDVHVRERVDLAAGRVAVNLAGAGEGVDPVDVHGAGAADSLTAGAPEGEGGVLLILDLEQGIEDHGSRVVQVNSVGLHSRLGRGHLGILSPATRDRDDVKMKEGGSSRVFASQRGGGNRTHL